MGFLTRNRSSQPVDRALPRIKSSWKKNNPSNRPEETLQPVTNKKTSDAFCESEIEDIDLEMQLRLAEGVSDENACMWLSSDCDSSSLFGSEISDLCLLNGWTQSFIDRVPLESVNSDSTLHPLQFDLSGELSKEEGFMNDQSVCSNESRGFSYDKSSCTSLATMDDLERSGTWISTLDLNLESSELIQLKDGVNSTYSDLSSPSCSYRVNPLSESSFSSPTSKTSYQTETCGSLLGEFDYDEPLFWPYNQNMYESSELGKSFLCVSPRKEKKITRKKEVNELKSVTVKPRKTNNQSTSSRKIMQLQCGRRLESSQMPKKSATGWKSIAPTSKSYNSSQHLSSRLSTSLAQASANKFPSNTSTKRRINSATKETPQLKSKNQINKVERLPIEALMEFEASFFHDVFTKGATIEKIVGLNEFDALEWLNLSFSEGCFIESMKKEESSQASIETFFLQL